jgi:hypothetical protein
MNIYLRKIGKKTNIEINMQRIIGQDLCKINKDFLQFLFKRNYNHFDYPTCDLTIYHKILFIFSLGILIFTLEIHCW